MSEENIEKKEPIRGNQMVTVGQSAELLKKLSEFTSKKEELLSRLSSISDRMEKRLARDDAASSMNSHIATALPTIKTTVESCSIKFVRTRETQAPVAIGNGVLILMPNKDAFDKEYEYLEVKDSEMFDGPGLLHDGNESAIIQHGDTVVIHTGICVAVQAGWSLLIRPVISGITVAGNDIIDSGYTDEVEVTISNTTKNNIDLEYGKALFFAIPIKRNPVECEELLKSTFKDYVAGAIHN